jgi:adenylylsulfate kinase
MEQKSTNITWHGGDINKEHRDALLKQKGVILWFTGLSGSGKSTTAVALEKALYEAGHAGYRLDGDNIRHGLNKDLGFAPEDRTENIRRIGEVAALMADAGLIVMASFISPYRKDRDAIREIVPQDAFAEVYVKVKLETAEDRDPKGLYKKARAGEIPEFTGISAPYEEPETPELTIDTDELSVEESVKGIMEWLTEQGYLS